MAAVVGEIAAEEGLAVLGDALMEGVGADAAAADLATANNGIGDRVMGLLVGDKALDFVFDSSKDFLMRPNPLYKRARRELDFFDFGDSDRADKKRQKTQYKKKSESDREFSRYNPYFKDSMAYSYRRSYRRMYRPRRRYRRY